MTIIRWTDNLQSDVYNRLCNCKSRKSDLAELVDAKWASMIAAGKREQGFTKEDALIAILELLDSNGRYFDLSAEEYSDLIWDIR